VITVTDLYHPPEDPGDNFDLVMPYGFGRIDLRAVVLDVSTEKREAVHAGVEGYPGPREPGIVPVTQLNAVFGRQVPFGVSPFARMRDLHDHMADVPAFQQTGVELLLETLRVSNEPVHIMSFGSARPIAVAFNREPDLMREKVARVHVSAGSTSLDYLEWNVYLDPLAMIRVVDSGLPISLYPCATEVDCYGYDEHNTLWWLENMAWVERMHPALRRYLTYGLGVSTRIDFLRALDEEPPDDVKRFVYSRRHAVWETAAWIQVSGSEIVRHADGSHEIVAREDLAAGDEVIPNEQVPCQVRTHESGLYTFELTDDPGTTTVFRRGDPRIYEAALRAALPRMYSSFVPEGWLGSTAGPVRDVPPAQYAGPMAS
jgi:hypothetical protein